MADTISAAELQTAMLAATNAVKDFGTNVNSTNAEFGNMIAEIKKLNKAFQDEFNATKKYLDDIVNAAKGKSKKGLRVEDRNVHKILNDIFRCVCKDEKKISGTKKGKNKSGGTNSTPDFEKIVEQADIGVEKAEKKLTKSINHFEDSYTKFAKSELRRSFYTDLAKGILSYQEALFGMTGKTNEIAEQFNFKSMLKDEQAFNRELRQTAYEVAGVTGESQKLQKSMTEIGLTTQETGRTRTEFQKEYLNNLKAGIGDTKVLNRLTKQSLGTERMLGLEAGELTEHFRKLNMHGQATVEQTAAIGRGMVHVAKSTGLTGKHLMAAVNASEDLNKQLQNTANFTASAANNILEIIANSQKLGVEGKAKEILSMATSINNLLESNGKKEQIFLLNAAARVGKIKELQMGVLTRSKTGMKALSDGMSEVLQRFGVESLEAIENLTDEKKMQLNLQLKAAFGMELGEVTRVVQSFQNASKGYVEKLGEINKKQQQNLNIEEKKAALEEKRKLKASAAMEVVTALSEATRGAKDMSQALANFDRRKGEFTDNMKAIGGDLTNTTQGIGFAYQTAAEQLNTRLKELGKEPITIDGADIEKALQDKDAQKVLNERLEKGFAMLQQAEKNATDPMTQVEQTLKDYNDYFKNTYAAPVVNLLTSLVGSFGLMVLALGGLGASGLIGGLTKLASYGLISGFGSKAAGAAAGGAAAAGAAGAAGSAAPAAAAASGLAGATPTGMLDKINWGSMKTVLGKAAIGIAGVVAVIGMIAVALVALAGIAAIVSKGFGIDPIQLAIDVSKIMLAASVIGAEIIIAYLALSKTMDAFEKYFTRDAMVKTGKFAIKLVAVTTAMMLLAGSILFITDKLRFGMTAEDAIRVATDVTTILAAAGIIAAAVIAGMFGLIHAGIALEGLTAAIAVAWPFILGLTIALPILAGGLVALGVAIIGACVWVLKKLNVNRDEIEETVIAINALMWGMTSILLAIVVAGAAVIGLGALIAKVMSMKNGLVGIVGSIALLAGIGYLMYKVYAWIDEFISGFEGIDSEEQKKKIANAVDYVMGMNKVLGGMLPVFAFIVGIGALMAYIQQTYGTKALARTVIYSIAFGALLAYAGPIFFKAISGVGMAIINMVKNMNINMEQFKKDTDKAILILDTYNKIMLRLLPTFLVIAGLAYLISQMNPKTLLIAGLAAFGLAALLPIITGALTASILATVLFVKDITSTTNLSQKDADVITEKFKAIVSVIQATASMAKDLAFAFPFATFWLAAAWIVSTGFQTALNSMTNLISNVAVKIKELDGAFSGLSASAMQQLSQKFVEFGNIITNLGESVKTISNYASTFSGGWFGTSGADLFKNLAATLSEMGTPIADCMKEVSKIGLIAYNNGSVVDPETVAKSFRANIQIVKNLVKFMNDMAKIKPPKKGFSNWFSNSSEEMLKSLENHFESIKAIVNLPRKMGVNKKTLEESNKSLKIISESVKMFSSAIVDLQKAFEAMQKIEDSAIKGKSAAEKVKTIVTEMFNVTEAIMTIASEKEDEFDAFKFIDTVNSMAKLSQVMSILPGVLENFGKSVEQILNLQGTTWWGYITGNRGDGGGLDKFNQSIKDGQTERSEFQKSLQQIFSGIEQLMTEVEKAVNNPILNTEKIQEIVYKLGLLQNVLANVFSAIESFCKKARELFKTGVMGFGMGDGAWAGEYGATIRVSIREIFESIKVILTEIIKIQEDPTWKKAESSLAEVNRNLKSLNKLLQDMAQNLQEFGSTMRNSFAFITPEKGMFTRSGGDYSKFNKFMADIEQTLTLVGDVLKQIVNVVDREIVPVVPGILRATETLQKVKPLMEEFRNAVTGFALVLGLWQNNPIMTTTLNEEQIKKLDNDVRNQLVNIGMMFNSIIKNINSMMINDPGSAVEKLKALEGLMGPITTFLEAFATHAGPLTTAISATEKTKAEKIVDSAAQIGAAMAGMTTLFQNIIRQLNSLPSPEGLKTAEAKMKSVGEMLKSLIGVLETSEESMSILTNDLGDNSVFVNKVGKILQNLEKANPIKDVFSMIDKALIKPLIQLNLDPKEVKKAAELLKGLAGITTSFAELLKGMAFSMRGVTSGKFGKTFLDVAVQALNKENTEKIVKVIESVAGFITPIQKLGIKAKDAENAAKVIKSAGEILQILGGNIHEKDGKMGLIGYIGHAIGDLSKQAKDDKGNLTPSAVEKATTALDNFAKSFELLAPHISKIIDAVLKDIGHPRDAIMAAKALTASRDILYVLAGGEGSGSLLGFINTEIKKIANGGGGEANPGDIDAATKNIEQLAIKLPPILKAIGGLIDAVFKDVGRARDVQFAAKSLQAIPDLLMAVEACTLTAQKFIVVPPEEIDKSEGVTAALDALANFVTSLNTDVITTLIDDTYSATENVLALDEALIGLCQAFNSVGDRMQELGATGAILSAMGNKDVNVNATTNVAASTAAGETAPGGGVGKQVMLATQTFVQDQGGIVQMGSMIASSLDNLAQTMGIGNETLVDIAGGVTGSKTIKAVKTVNKAKKFLGVKNPSTNVTNSSNFNGGMNRSDVGVG